MVFVFTFSHGQAQIERGLNINSDLLVENILPPSIIAQRRVYDHLNSLDYQMENDLRIQCTFKMNECTFKIQRTL